MVKKRSILLIYRYFYPDPVASSKHFSDLAQSLFNKGWDVYVLTGNRMRHQSGTLPEYEIWSGIKIIRTEIWDIFNNFNTKKSKNLFFDKSILEKIFNTIFFKSTKKNRDSILKRFLEQYSLILNWKKKLTDKNSFFNLNNIIFDKIFIGTDPALSFLLFPFLKSNFKNSELIYWIFDLYPDIFYKHFDIPKILNFNRYFRYVDKVLYLDSDMKNLIQKRFLGKKLFCATPWGFAEPNLDEYFENIKIKKTEKESDFKNLVKAEKLIILYSGNLGRGHSFEDFLKLAKLTEGDSVEYIFSSFGENWERLKKVQNLPQNLKLMSGVSYEELGEYLSKADIHFLSLKNGWEGLMLPSKLFGSMAVGKGVIFSGSSNSSIAKFILENKIGNVINSENIVQMAQLIRKIIKNRDIITQLGENSYNLYKKLYSKNVVTKYIENVIA